MRTKHFLDVHQAQARRQPDKTDFIYLEYVEDEAERLTFAELHEPLWRDGTSRNLNRHNSLVLAQDSCCRAVGDRHEHAGHAGDFQIVRAQLG